MIFKTAEITQGAVAETVLHNAVVAEGMGAWGVQVSDSKDLPDALRAAQASGKPAVVDVLIDTVPSPDDWRAGAWRAGHT